jgi:hypothetical protein
MNTLDYDIAMTEKTPEVKWKSLNSELTIKGRSIPEDCQVFYLPIIEMIQSHKCKKITLNFLYEYINTSSSLIIFKLLQAIETNKNIKSIFMNWYYEDDDLDMLELGEMYSEKLSRTKFEYIEYIDVLD